MDHGDCNVPKQESLLCKQQHKVIKPVKKKKKKKTLEVCQGPDCFGCGGGAALLEIEELWQEEEEAQRGICEIELVRGACRNFCSMGPNVHFDNCQQQFTKVKSIVECRQVMERVVVAMQPHQQEDDDNEPRDHGASSATTATASPTTTLTRMLTLRAERERWNFLRKVAQVRKKSKNNRQQRVQEQPSLLLLQLEEIAALETKIVKDDVAKRERVLRRKERYKQFLSLGDANEDNEDEQGDEGVDDWSVQGSVSS